MRTVLDDITVGYDDQGSGEPLVLVHGHPFNRAMWELQVKRFAAAGWRVIVPDLRGYGESTVVPGATPLETFARDIAGLLDHLGVDRIVIGGLSMGGQIVLEFHRLFPKRVIGLVLADTSPLAETEDGKRARHALAERLLCEGLATYAVEVLPKMMTPRNITDMPAVADHVLEMMRTTSPEGAAAALRGRAERPDYVEMLSAVAVPTLIVVGREDELTPLRDARLMHERIAGSTLAVVDGAGHMPNLERPQQFDEVLQRFLDSIASRPAVRGKDRRQTREALS